MVLQNTETKKKSAIFDWKVTIGGKKIDTRDSADVEEIVVDQLADGPSMAYCKLNTNLDLEWLDSSDAKQNKPMMIDMGFGGDAEDKPEPVFKGTVVGWEPLFHGKAPGVVLVRAFNKLHAASRGRRTKAWLDKKLSEVAAEIAGKYGMGTGQIECTKIKQPYIYQANMTDLDFLRELAERVGYEVGCDIDDNLTFRMPKFDAGPVAKLVWGDNLKRFKARANAGQPISKVSAYYWDAKLKKFQVASSCHTDIKSKMGGSKDAGQFAGQFEKDSAELAIRNRPFYSSEDALAQAKGLMNQLALQYIIAEAEVEGTPKAHAGRVVQVEEVGKRFSGNYYIVRARHVIQPNPSIPDAGYVTYLTLRRTGSND